MECSCCGKGTLEIKCPYSCRDKAFEEASKDKSFYLQSNDEGDLLLTKDHVYYYQIQMQMEVCQTEYCDFVVWSKDQLLCQRILYDKEFIKAKLDSLGEFIIKCVLPELIAKWFTKPELGTNDESTSDVNPPLDNASSSDANVPADSINPADVVNATEDNDFVNPTADSHREPSGTTDTSDSEVELWCYCRQDENFDYLIGCDNDHCTIKWFHLSCVNMTMEEVPDGDWFCPDCSQTN